MAKKAKKKSAVAQAAQTAKQAAAFHGEIHSKSMKK
jgi:hypothetical protein